MTPSSSPDASRLGSRRFMRLIGALPATAQVSEPVAAPSLRECSLVRARAGVDHLARAYVDGAAVPRRV